MKQIQENQPVEPTPDQKARIILDGYTAHSDLVAKKNGVLTFDEACNRADAARDLIVSMTDQDVVKLLAETKSSARLTREQIDQTLNPSKYKK